MKITFFIWISVILLYLPANLVAPSTDLECKIAQDTFILNETFDLRLTQSRSYNFPLWLDWVGTHARVRIQGGVITGRIPSSLVIKTVLDGAKSQQTFEQKNGLQRYYTFHSDSEFIMWIQPPTHPQLSGIKTLHNFTVELHFSFSVSPEGTGIIKEIVFETFTPLPFNTGSTPIIPLQDQFSWQVTSWSFGSLFFSTPLLISLDQPQNVSVQATVRFSELALDGWQLILEQEERELRVRDVHKLTGSLAIDPALPFILSLSVDPPAVSEPSLITVTIEVQGGLVPSPGSSSPELDPSTALSSQTLAELVWLFQLGLVFMPLLVYYRHRRLTWSN